MKSPETALTAPLIATLFVIGSLATIPYAAPATTWYMTLLGALGITAIAVARFDRTLRWNKITVWPVPLLVGSWAMAIASSSAQEVSLERSASMALFSMLFITAQIAAWHALSMRIMQWSIISTVLACTLDIVWQWRTGASLILELSSNAERLAGSQGNPNDLAVVSALLPLASTAFRGTLGLIALIAVAALVSPTWILSGSRQAALGWFIATLGPFVARTRFRTAVIATLSFVVVCSGVVATSTVMRGRMIQTWKRGLAERQEIIAFGGHLFLQHPITGVGPGLYGAYYKNAAIEGWNWQGKPLPKVGMPWVHNLPVEVLCETGVVGATAVVTILGAAAVRLRRSIRGGGAARDLAIAVATGFLVIAAMGMIDLSFLKDWVRCVCWLLLGLAYARQTAAEPAIKLI